MTLQQMEYIVALNKFRHFVLAAESCGITQPTLSTMIQKLEDELGVRIFERTNKSVVPTQIGEKIIQQAQTAINETLRIKEIIADETGTTNGTVKIGVTPTVAPYLIPDFIYEFRHAYPDVHLFIDEMKSNNLMNELRMGNIDVGISTGQRPDTDLLEIPLFREKFVLYFSSNCSRRYQEFTPEELATENMWVLKESHCMKNAAFSFCKSRAAGQHIYEAGSIDTLIKIVDRNGGYTIIPELHRKFLTEEQDKQVREIQGSSVTQRDISLFIKSDFIRERMLNAIAQSIIKNIPAHMVDERLKKFGIRL